MAEIDYKIKYILESYSEEMFNYLLYLQRHELNGMSGSEKIDIARWCASIGENALMYTTDWDCSVQELAIRMGVRDIQHFNNGLGGNGDRACYEPSSAIIYINDNSIMQQMKILKYYELCYFSRYDILNMYILHELFHHIEYKITGSIDMQIKKRFHVDGDFDIFRDISAFSFANSYMNTFPCQILDFLFKCYFYPELEWCLELRL